VMVCSSDGNETEGENVWSRDREWWQHAVEEPAKMGVSTLALVMTGASIVVGWEYAGAGGEWREQGLATKVGLGGLCTSGGCLGGHRTWVSHKRVQIELISKLDWGDFLGGGWGVVVVANEWVSVDFLLGVLILL